MLSRIWPPAWLAVAALTATVVAGLFLVPPDAANARTARARPSM